MTPFHDEDERLTLLLRAIPFPEPSPDFLAGARRRYLEAVEARYRREAFTGLLAAAFVLSFAAILLLSTFKPATLIVRVAVTIAGFTKWMDGIGVVLSLVPSVVWPSAVLVSVVFLLSIASLLRVRSPVAAK